MSEQNANGAVLVVGGGISGLTAALEAAEVGKDVFLIEKILTWAAGLPSLISIFLNCVRRVAAWR